MQLKQGANVYTVDDQHVGGVDRVVINPGTKEVTHIVVRRGVLFIEDKVVPVRLINSTTEDAVRLRVRAAALENLPRFEESYYLTPEEVTLHDYETGYARPLYWYPPVGIGWDLGYYTGYEAEPYAVHVEQNIPKDTVGLKEGARIVASDGEAVGHLECVFTDEKNRATHLLVKAGWLFATQKLIPVHWIRTVDEDEIQLTVNAGVLALTPGYHPHQTNQEAADRGITPH
ncbi:MAG: PRC-barrel domain containing protein [Caldilinea sp. CFX5]|nr:PRC-barrel domain containing protein [Caldilinea sp. CFX5]